MTQVYNFNAGPAVLPHAVLEQAQAELLDYRGRGVSILELSHRSKEYTALNSQAEQQIKRLLRLDDDYRVLFLQGGASLQFAMVPLNLLPPGASADYLITGAWAEKAYEEAGKIGQARIAASSAEGGFRAIPPAGSIDIDPRASYVHITTNETIQGVQWHSLPEVGGLPLVADMSSDILSRPRDGRQFALIYAGAQKNLGPAGVTVVIVRESLIRSASRPMAQGRVIPTMLDYETHMANDSLYNTPSVFAVYMLSLVLEWIDRIGGLEAVASRNTRKAEALYGSIDRSGGFYRGHAEPQARSLMNVTFRLPALELEQQFIAEATAEGMIGLAGHRSVGGIRASIYNAMDEEGCRALADFMDDFLRRNG